MTTAPSFSSVTDVDPAEPPWSDPAVVHGVRLFTRQPVTLPWLAATVLPAARALQAPGRLVHLRRGWLHGPHVDILVRGGSVTTPGWSRLAGSLDAGPADPRTALTPEDYLRQAQELGRLENVHPPYLPYAEHGAVELIRPAEDAEDAGPLDSLKDAVLGTQAPVLFDLIDHLAVEPADGPSRLVEAYLALADTHPLGVGFGTYSFRSHVEGFLAWVAPRRDLRPTFAARLDAERAQLQPVVERQLAGTFSASARAWRTAFAYSAGVLDSAVALGALSNATLDEMAPADQSAVGPPGAPDAGPTGSRPRSEFHDAVAAAGVLDKPFAWFAGYRVLINLFYQQLPLLMVSPLQRNYMCFAVSELVDASLGETWRQRLAGAGPLPDTDLGWMAR